MMAAHRRYVDELGEHACIEVDQASEATTIEMGNAEARVPEDDKAGLLDYLYRSQIGSGQRVRTAFGERLITFADYTASGRSLQDIESFLQTEVLPVYANTHTTASATGMQTTLFRAEARTIVRRALGCENNRDAVLFTGTGCTGAIGKMVDLLKGTPRWKASVAAGVAPLVVVGPYEHHSNLLPWRENGCRVIMVREADGGGVDMDHLERVLREHAASPLKLGTFSAASNLTGILCDTVALSVALHRHKALAFFDYATAGPYTAINMNPVVSDPAQAPLAYKDAVFISPHKFVGGVGTPGVLAFKKEILDNSVAFGSGAPPALPGGGTVFFVTEHDHRYLGNLEEREEAGTPDIIGAIRCGLVMRLKESVGVATILEREHAYWSMAKAAWGCDRAIHLLGNMDAERLPVVAFNIRFGFKYLHHNFVAALLNDLFGIQVRAGCSCAGPYAQRLLGIDYVLAKQYEAALLQGDEVLRPGLVRLNLHYCLPAHVVEYLLKAVSFVAAHGWKLLPLYTFIPDTGEWRHRSERKFALRHRRWLSDVRFDAGAMHMRPTHTDAKSMDAASAAGGPGAGVLGAAVESFGGGDLGLLSEETGARYLEEAMAQVAKVAGAIRSGKPYGAGLWTEKQVAAEAMALRSPEAARLRWFMYPSEAIAALKGKAEVGWGSEDGCEDGGKASQPCVPQGWQAVNGAWCSEEGAGSGQEQKGAVRQQAYAVSGFERFALQQQTALLQRQPHATFQDVLQVAGEAWRSLSGAQREAYAVAQDGEGLHANEGRTRSPIPTPAGPPPAPSVTAGSMQEEDARGSKHEGGSACDDREAACESGCAGQPGSEQAGGGEGRSAVGSEAGVGGGRGRKAKGGRKAGAGGGEATETVMVCPLKPKGQGVCEDPAARKKRGDKTQKKIMNLVGKAIMDFGMIRDGDRVLVGLSGGKDSLTLLHILLALQRKAPIRFDIGACTVDPQTPEYDPSVLKVYLKELGVPYFYQSHGIIEQASCSLQKNSLCSFCSRMKRGILYSTCKREGYGVLALGQHLDDQAESLLMSCFHNGQLRTMKAHYMALEHSVRVIRPLNYCREYLMRDFAHARALPVVTENCPGCFEAPKERARIKMVLAQQEQIFPDLFSKLLKSMLPLMAADCAAPDALVVRELQHSKHTAERAMMGGAAADTFDEDDDDAAPPPVGAGPSAPGATASRSVPAPASCGLPFGVTKSKEQGRLGASKLPAPRAQRETGALAGCGGGAAEQDGGGGQLAGGGVATRREDPLADMALPVSKDGDGADEGRKGPVGGHRGFDAVVMAALGGLGVGVVLGLCACRK